MRNPFKRDPPAPVEPADESTRQKETPAPAKDYPGINFDVCRMMVAQGRSRREVADWLVYHYPGYFPTAEIAETAF
jgi:hypothetical protein